MSLIKPAVQLYNFTFCEVKMNAEFVFIYLYEHSLSEDIDSVFNLLSWCLACDVMIESIYVSVSLGCVLFLQPWGFASLVDLMEMQIRRGGPICTETKC